MLGWWSDRCRDRCLRAVERGYWEQLWFSTFTIYFPRVETLQHPGFNVSWFNLNERALSFSDDGYRVNGSYPLVDFHFVFYAPDDPERSALYYPAAAFDRDTPLGSLCSQYGESPPARIRRAEEHAVGLSR